VSQAREDLPHPAPLLGLAGLLPFAGLLALALLGPEGWRAPVLGGLAAYGAVILSFLGAVHWGFALRAPAPEAAATLPRLALGVLPSILAWIALLVPLAPGLALLAMGIAGTAVVEERAAAAGLMPAGYFRLRRWLSLGASTCLAAGAVLA
jgi:hypothetical protein